MGISPISTPYSSPAEIGLIPIFLSLMGVLVVLWQLLASLFCPWRRRKLTEHRSGEVRPIHRLTELLINLVQPLILSLRPAPRQSPARTPKA